MRNLFVFVVCFLFTLQAAAQLTGGLQRADFSVTFDGENLENPWVGGFDNPQFSLTDLNNDGTPDLYVFDRVGNVHRTFLYTDGTYTFAPEYADNFPNIRNFCLLRDYDGDGIADISAHSKSAVSFDGLVVWKGKYEGDKLAFDRFQFDYNPNFMPYTTSSGMKLNLYVPGTDIPDIADIDGDGDLDVLAFDVTGDLLKYYQNQSVEEGHGTDSLIFIKADNCWGKFYEAGMAEDVTLSDNPNMCAEGFADDASERHAGSTTTTIDLNDDGARELLIGDLINPYLYLLENGGTAENAWMTDQDNSFPSYDTPVFIPNFCASYVADFDQDGRTDFVAAANANQSPNYEAAWLYTNVGTEANKTFELQKKTFMTESMLDLGSGTHPALADVNGDGLTDLVVGTEGYNVEFGARDARLFLFLNTGTADSPAFTLESDDWLGFTQYTIGAAQETYGFAPTFGDIDGDGDLDLFVGEYYGTLFYGENTGGAGAAMEFDFIAVEWQNLDVGLFSVPQVADLDRDGLLDLVIGERNGNVNWLKNVGTVTEPLFNEDENAAPNINFIGEANAALPSDGFGNSAPFFVDLNGEWTLYLGTRSQGVVVYNGVDINNLAAPFNVVEAGYGNIAEGLSTHPVLADLDGNAQLDLLIGNFRGGLGAYKTDVSTAVANLTAKGALTAYPNPARNTLQVMLPDFETAQPYQIYDAVGRMMSEGILQNADNYLSVKRLAGGIYFLRTPVGTVKFVKE